MAKTIEVPQPQGQSATCKLFAIGSDTVVETITLTEATNRKGIGTGTIASASGWNRVVVFVSSNNVGDFVVYVGSTDPATYQAVDDAAIDWAKIQNPTTTVGLSGTTVKTATDVETDTADIQSRLPAALTGDGNIKADTLRIGGTTQTAKDLGAINVTTLNTLSGHDPGETIMGATDLGTGSGLTSLATQASVDDLPTNAELATALGTADDAILAAIAALNNLSAAAVNAECDTAIADAALATAAALATVAGYIDTEVAAIKAKTDNLPVDPADASDIATAFSGVNTKLDTIDDFLDTEIAAIKAKTDNLPSDPADQSLVESAITAATSPLATASALSSVATDASTAATQATSANTVVSSATYGNSALKTLIDAVPTTIRLKKNTAFSNFSFVMLDESGDPAVGKTVTGTVILDGAAAIPLTNSVSEIGGGWYKIDLAAADLNANSVGLEFIADGCRHLQIGEVLQP